MGLEFLARIRRTSLWLGGIAALLTATSVSPGAGLGVALGAAWSLVNLGLLQMLIVALTTRGGGERRARRRSWLAFGGLVLLFAAGGGLLFALSPLALLAGFLLPHAVMLGKAVALLIMPTRFWRRVTSDARVAAPVVLGALALLWVTLPSARTALAKSAQHHAARHAPTAAHHAAQPAVQATAPQRTMESAAQAGAEARPAGEPAEGKAEGPPEFPTVVTVIERLFPHAPWAHALVWFEPLLFSIVIALLLIWAARAATAHPELIPGRLQNIVELAVEQLNDFIIGILGPAHGPRFVPLLGTLFIYILCMNLIGLIPFMRSPTSSLNVTVALALTVFVYVQWIGIRGLGIGGYIFHMMGAPRDVVGWILVPLMLPIHLLGELAKPISLSCRLFGNVFGEDMLLVGFATLGITLMGAIGLKRVPVGVPLHAIFFPLALLSSALQAMVFTVLSTIYILLMLPHDHDHGHGHEPGDEAPDLI